MQEATPPASQNNLLWRGRTASGQRISAALVAVLALKIVFLIVLALNTRFVMDEFMHFSASRYLSDLYSESSPAKTVGSVVMYKLAHWLAWDAVSALLIGRFQTVLIALATVAMIYAISRELGNSRVRALIVIVVILSFSTFIERSFRLRSEPAALLFATMALLVMVRPSSTTLGRIFVAGVLSGLAFACTQKSVYFNVALGVGIVADRLVRRETANALWDASALLAGWFAVMVTYCLVFGGVEALGVAHDIVFRPAYVAFHAHKLYANLGQFVAQTLLRNAPLYFACALGLALTLVQFRCLSRQVRIAAVFTFVTTVLVFRHNQPWPYVFTMALPFLSLWPLALYDLFAVRPQGARLFQIMAVLVLAISFGRNVQYLQHDNRLELHVVRQAEALLRPDQTYFDGIGMIPTRFDVPRIWLDVHGVRQTLSEGKQSTLIRSLETAPPDLIITSYRTDRLAELLAPLINQSYVEVAPHILIPGINLPVGSEVFFKAPVDGKYDIYSNHVPADLRQAVVNGEERSFPTMFTRGEYRIRLDEAVGQYTLLSAGLPKPLPPVQSDLPLFAEVYTY